ncbi:MAG: hypothetical protein IPF50_12320 [Proteobacteria bacterium]|nr:hypothetical protein [Pseudomonadota bacterium]
MRSLGLVNEVIEGSALCECHGILGRQLGSRRERRAARQQQNEQTGQQTGVEGRGHSQILGSGWTSAKIHGFEYRERQARCIECN